MARDDTGHALDLQTPSARTCDCSGERIRSAPLCNGPCIGSGRPGIWQANSFLTEEDTFQTRERLKKRYKRKRTVNRATWPRKQPRSGTCWPVTRNAKSVANNIGQTTTTSSAKGSTCDRNWKGDTVYVLLVGAYLPTEEYNRLQVS
jgi:hypothetical protein